MRYRFWIECCALLATFALWVITITQPDWIERLLPGVTADHGDGTLEWAMVAASLAVNAVLGAAALREWRRHQRVPSPARPAR